MPLKGDYEPSTMKLARDQVELYESSGGTEGTTLGHLIGWDDATRRDLPVVVLTTLGAKSGKIRKSPLMRVEHDGSYAVVASSGGAPKHPVWYHNVVADPRVELRDGPVRRDMLAREVTGDEKTVWWARAVEAFPDYAEYQKKVDREIPVPRSSPVGHQGGDGQLRPVPPPSARPVRAISRRRRIRLVRPSSGRQREAVKGKCVGERFQIAAPQFEGIAAGPVAFAMAALSEGEDVIVPGEEARDLVPVPCVVYEPMQKNEWRCTRITCLAIMKCQLRKLDAVVAENGHQPTV